MDIGRIAVRALLVYIYLLFITRASGKRVISQATPVDLMVALIVGDLIDDALWAEVSMAKFAVAAATICACDVVATMASHRWSWALRLMNGSPAIVLRDGAIDRDVLRNEQLNDDEVRALLRNRGHEDASEVQMGLLERDEELSLILRPDAMPAQKQDARFLP